VRPSSMDLPGDRTGVTHRRTGPAEGPPGPTERGAAREVLQHEIATCTRCALHQTRTRAVIYRGGPAPKIVFVGEAPGAEEDRQGVPFVGRSGKRLDAAIASIGLRTEEFGVLNLVKCRPPKNRFDLVAERACRPYLQRQLELLRPEALVSLGAHALQALDPSAPRILLCAGRPRKAEGRDLFPLIHPAAALRSTTLARRWTDDVQRLAAWISSTERQGAREPL
jgi:uracil-DNA glycosylase